MRRWYISEMDARARSLAQKYGMGVEIIDFCIPENLEDHARIAQMRQALRDVPLSLHAPYCEIFPSAIDPLIRSVALRRLQQAAEICMELGAPRMIAHSGYVPQMYYPEWFVPRSIEFWREYLQTLPSGVEVLLENVLDTQPEHLARVCDGVDDARLKLCLDVGHVNAYSKQSAESWIQFLGERIAHVHLHNNHGAQDTHSALADGSIAIEGVLSMLEKYAPAAAICIESMDAQACLDFLTDGGFLNVQY